MTLVARYPGWCRKCGKRVQPGQAVEWDPKTRKVEHVTCPSNEEKPKAQTGLKTKTADPKPVQLPEELLRPGARRYAGPNRKPDSCDRCGKYLQPGEGVLVHCLEDSGCMKHFDFSGYHVFCLDFDACKARAEEKRAAEQRQKEVADQLKASVTRERVEIPEGAEKLAQVSNGYGVYGTAYWLAVGDTVYYQKWEPAAYDGWDLVAYRTTATREQVQQAIEIGAIIPVAR